jgi:hypothetical protein
VTAVIEQLQDPAETASLEGFRAELAWLAGDYAMAVGHHLNSAEDADRRSIFLAQALRSAVAARDLHLLRLVAGRYASSAGGSTPLNAAERLGLDGAIAALEDRRADALRLYDEGIRRLSELGYDFDVARTTLEATELLGPDEAGLRPAIERAREIFARVGARPYLERLDAALAERPATGYEPASRIDSTATKTPAEAGRQSSTA